MPEVSPEEIKIKFPTLGQDAVLKPLLGSTTTDPRVYFYYQGEAEISAQKKSYITYAHLATPERTQAVGEPVFSLAIWAIDQATIKSVRDRLVVLLDETPLTTGSGKAIFATLIGERDSFQENTKFNGKTLQFRFGYSRVTDGVVPVFVVPADTITVAEFLQLALT
jgi:hypothetical protein